MFKEPKIVFHHIPKCGGTSIVTGMVTAYYPLRLLRYGRKGFPSTLNAPASTYAADLYARDRYTFRRELLAYNVHRGNSPIVSGHFPFCRKLYDGFKDEWSFVTLLRHPLERWYSEYFWNRYKSHQYEHTDLSAEAYLETFEGRAASRSFVNFFTEAQDLATLATEKELKGALETLPKMRVIGCLEHMERFRCDMKDAFGRKPMVFNRNQSPAHQVQRVRPDTNSAFHKHLEDLLAADIEIYQGAKNILKL